MDRHRRCFPDQYFPQDVLAPYRVSFITARAKPRQVFEFLLPKAQIFFLQGG